jgi:hypothetical protein
LKSPTVTKGPENPSYLQSKSVTSKLLAISLKVSPTLFRRAAPNFKPSKSFYIGISTKLELSTLPTDKKKTSAKFAKLGQTCYLGSSEPKCREMQHLQDGASEAI